MAPSALLILFAAAGLAQDPDEPPPDPSCCAHEVSAALRPLREGASDKERRPRQIHDGIDAARHYALGKGHWTCT